MSFFDWIASLFKKKTTPLPSPGNSAPPSASTPAITAPPPSPSPNPITPPSSAPLRPSGLPQSNHYASQNRMLMEAEYAYLYPQVVVTARFANEARNVISWATSNRDVFQRASDATHVPWWVIAAINNLEMGTNLNGTILNGDPWKEKTKHYPSGLGPWNNWLDACIWGLRHEALGWNFDLAKWKWNVSAACYFAESYNGHNARLSMGGDTVPPNASPYVYSGTQFYESGKMTEVEYPAGSGKYVGRFDPSLVSDQLGFMAFMRTLEQSGENLFP